MNEVLNRILLVITSIIPVSLFAAFVGFLYWLWVSGQVALSVSFAVLWFGISWPVFALALIVGYDAMRIFTGGRPFLLALIEAVGGESRSRDSSNGAKSLLIRFASLTNPLTPLLMELTAYVMSRAVDESALRQGLMWMARARKKRRNAVVLRPIFEVDHDLRQQVGVRS